MALHYLAESAFDDLLTLWRHHDELQRRAGVALPVLTASRKSLDCSRQRMRRLRAALYPTDTDAEAELMAILCPALDEVVHLGWTHQTHLFPGTLTCICGERIPIL